MCGIAGIISREPGTVQTVQEMITCLSHRGPDGEGTWQSADKWATLGHRRLAILDLSAAGAQPMHYGERYTIVHNGEIYNYRELRTQLQEKGYSFRSQSDTEVILAAFDRWHGDCLQQFDGMFAFAIWDNVSKTLFAARDRFGEKPLYYRYDETAASLSFASELKALKKTGSAAINHSILLNYLANGISFSADDGASFYQQIFKLPARHYLHFNPGKNELKIVPWYDVDTTRHDMADEDAVSSFRQLFTASISRRLRSDVEIGTSLSGGIDSASVVAGIQQLKEAGLVHQAFTVGFTGFEKDETAKAALVANTFGLQHHVISLTAEDLLENVDRFLQAHDEPVSSSSVFAQYELYRLAAAHGVKVMLDGQGADEVLAGYTRYFRWMLIQLFREHSPLLKQEIAALQQPFGFADKMAAMFPSWAAIRLERRAIHNQTQRVFNRDYVNAYLNKHDTYKPAVRSLNDILYHDVFLGPLEELLRNADRNAMAHGIEVRLPFLEPRLVQFAFSLPATLKVKNGYTKFVLRKAMEHKLPGDIVWNKEKIGFEPPQHQWMSLPALQDRVRKARATLVAQGILHRSILQQPINAAAAHEAGNLDWRILCAAHWF